jgi:ComF family protein
MKKLLFSFLQSLSHLFIPRECAVCGRVLVEGEYLFCTACRWNMPLTNTWNASDNPIREKLHTLFMAEQASALFYYQKRSGYDNLVHRFKYSGKASLAYALGRWFGRELRQSGLYGDVDLIVPVPLHPLRRMKRGYNQSECVARGIGKSLGKPVTTSNLIRKVHNRSQTRHDSADRWENVAGIFAVRDPEAFRGKHILLVDDVLTTGATLDSCAETIRTTAGACRISVTALAASPKDIPGTV